MKFCTHFSATPSAVTQSTHFIEKSLGQLEEFYFTHLMISCYSFVLLHQYFIKKTMCLILNTKLESCDCVPCTCCDLICCSDSAFNIGDVESDKKHSKTDSGFDFDEDNCTRFLMMYTD